mmetsp:Transcript_92219/g.199388  ORF Transcript_92219/g.199388 Transcript_92219/m.199388 type:complete len:260 (-) Transcript_92219:70-849(-)
MARGFGRVWRQCHQHESGDLHRAHHDEGQQQLHKVPGPVKVPAAAGDVLSAALRHPRGLHAGGRRQPIRPGGWVRVRLRDGEAEARPAAAAGLAPVPRGPLRQAAGGDARGLRPDVLLEGHLGPGLPGRRPGLPDRLDGAVDSEADAGLDAGAGPLRGELLPLPGDHGRQPFGHITSWRNSSRYCAKARPQPLGPPPRPRGERWDSVQLPRRGGRRLPGRHGDHGGRHPLPARRRSRGARAASPPRLTAAVRGDDAQLR